MQSREMRKKIILISFEKKPPLFQKRLESLEFRKIYLSVYEGENLSLQLYQDTTKAQKILDK